MFLFIVFALIAIVAALGVILSRKPVYSALFLLLNFATLAALYIMLHAQFLAAVQIIVYAGAIVVLFLFVVMLIGGGELGHGDKVTGGQGDTGTASAASPRHRVAFGWPRVTALVLAVLLLAGLGYGLITGQLHAGQGSAAAFGQGSVEAVGTALYTDYLLPFEMTSVLLLVGMIGAVVLARHD
ncbi:MAG: NADH-quinone oxidoreductase subunit [Chloroflexota bacterium]|nr:NADH-quinone oxidoreductase subunit [Chloroflexota bacterium]